MVISIEIPEEVKCLLKSGQMVNFDTPFLERKTQIEKDIFLAKEMGIEPDKIFHYLKKFVGENITKGETLAIKKDLLSTRKVTCDYDGVIKEIDHTEGKVILASYSNEKKTLPAFFKGEVLEVKKNSFSLKVTDGLEVEIKKTDNDFGGEVFYLKDNLLTPAKIGNKILLAQEISSYLQAKAETLGATGFVTLTKLKDHSDLPQAQIKEISDFKKIVEAKYSYCLIIKKNSRIYFYR